MQTSKYRIEEKNEPEYTVYIDLGSRDMKKMMAPRHRQQCMPPLRMQSLFERHQSATYPAPTARQVRHFYS